MTKKVLDAEMRGEFERAIRLRDGGDLVGAMRVLRELSARAPGVPSVLGTLAGLEYQTGEYERAVETGQEVVRLAPRSELGSLTLFHALYALGRVSEAFSEVARFRASTVSKEYDKLLSEVREEVSARLMSGVGDKGVAKVLAAVEAELAVRPILS